jgi:hypothetical protein
MHFLVRHSPQSSSKDFEDDAIGCGFNFPNSVNLVVLVRKKSYAFLIQMRNSSRKIISSDEHQSEDYLAASTRPNTTAILANGITFSDCAIHVESRPAEYHSHRWIVSIC